MLLLDLPSELLLVIYHSLPDTRTLYALSQTCTYAKEIYRNDYLSILNNVLRNLYADDDYIVKETIDALRSNGELDYAYIIDHTIKWLPPTSSAVWSSHSACSTTATSVLRNLLDLEHDTATLAELCTPHCRQKLHFLRDSGAQTESIVTQALLRLQLITNRLYNVRMPVFPEQVSLRAHERDRLRNFISRKTRDQVRDLTDDQLHEVSVPDLRVMWLLMQILQDNHQTLRRHRLRPHPGSLMDLLFEHTAEEGAWSTSPWFSVQRLLSNHGVHVVPARPGTSFRFLGQEETHELQEKDIAEFDAYSKPLLAFLRLDSDSPGYRNMSNCLDGYLDRFRPYMGLPYLDDTPVSFLVEPVAPIRSMKRVSKGWTYASPTAAVQSALGDLLDSCAEENRRRRVSESKQRLISGRRDSGTQ